MPHGHSHGALVPPFLVHFFGSAAVPINIFQSEYRSGNAPIRVSYHGGNHYNAVIDPEEASVGQVWRRTTTCASDFGLALPL